MDLKLNIYYQNARGLRTKTDCFKRNVYLNSYDIISITETWLLDGIQDQELFDSRYVVWRRDRDYSRTNQALGGGVLLAVRRDYAAMSRPDWHTSNEDLWITVSPIGRSRSACKIHFCTIYLCKQNEGYSSHQQLEFFSNKLFDVIYSNPNDKFVILGDFNLPFINWSSHSSHHLSGSGSVSLNRSQINFIDTLAQCNLSQRCQVLNDNNRLLDLIFSNCELTVNSCDEPLVPEDIPHHKSLCIELTHCSIDCLGTNSREKFFYNRGNYDEICNALDLLEWTKCLNNISLEEAVKYFYDCLYDLRNAYVPHKIVSSNNYPPWYSPALIKVLKEKYKYHRKYKVYGNHNDYLSFALLRSRAKSLERSCYELYIQKTEILLQRTLEYFGPSSKAIQELPQPSHQL